MKAIAALSTPPTAPTPHASVEVTATSELLDVVVAAGYAGPAWQELQRRLVARAYPDLEQAIRRGTIYGRCARARVGIPRRWDLERPPYSEDIAAEAVEECLERFRTSVLPEGQWDPNEGTSLEDFFVVCCLPDVANRWRWHLRRIREMVMPLDHEDDEQVVALHLVESGTDPSETTELRDLVVQVLAPMAHDDRIAFVMLAEGWSTDEVARTLGIGRDALYARISRARSAARARRTP